MRKNNVNKFRAFLFSMLVCLAFVYALPNFYSKSPSVVIIPKSGVVIDSNDYKDLVSKLKVNAKLSGNKTEFNVMFKSIEDQMKGYKEIKDYVDNDNFYVNLTLLPTFPEWLNYFNAQSASLGLDLMGGVHFLMEVDIEHVKTKAIKNYKKKVIKEFNDQNVSGTTLSNGDIVFSPYSEKLKNLLISNFSNVLNIETKENTIIARLNSLYIKDTIDYAVKQNIFILKNRVNEIGVAEPIVQREGFSRIVVQLPGIQDTQKARDLIGTTASLSFKKLKEDNVENEDSEFVSSTDGLKQYLFYKEPIINGKSIIDASSGVNPENNSSVVSVTLDSDGGDKMFDYTSKNTGTYMGSIMIETSYHTKKDSEGIEYKEKKVTKSAINVARIQSSFSTRFQITGLDSKEEAHTLAILLRSGSLAAPIDIIEERTIGPNMGAENIENGKLSIFVGFIMVLILMIVKYKTFGFVANFCVVVNLMLLLSLLSMIGATLTLPGIAGILLTVGMAVDGNVVIFERIKEEYRNKNNVKKAIKNGYDKAFSSIIDANVTTFIAAFILFVLGTGPVKGFAITLSIGIITSIITSVYLSRFIVETFYSNKKEINI